MAKTLNFALLRRVLGAICLLIGASMSMSFPFAFPALAKRTHLPAAASVESDGVRGLLYSMLISMFIGTMLLLSGRRGKGAPLFRKEAMAIVGLSWVMATVLGALPYYLTGIETAPDRTITFIEAMFESQAGFSTTGATILTDLENPDSVPHCILFWRSWTHFLGGLGIVVLFVAILGQGSAGKAMVRAEMPGPSKDGSMPRMQHTALVFAGIYCGLNALLTVIYMLEGMTLFDALCHAFGTMATGGFSTYNASLGAFESSFIEYTTILFMILAGTNFTLLYLTMIGGPKRLIGDVEFQTFVGIIVGLTVGIVFFGMRAQDLGFESIGDAVRNGLFQVVSIITTTGYGTADFDKWNNFGRGSLLLLMFVGGCAGSTGGGMKVIRHVLFYKILRREIELAYRPRVVRLIRIGETTADDPAMLSGIMVYFCLILGLFVASWMLLVTFEPNTTWGGTPNQSESVENTLDEKLLDCASAVAATLNNIGPGLGVVGATQNYAGFSQGAKFLFVWLMLLGRVEVFSVLVLVFPGFWRRP
ncbi:MAG: TrkH family potassium uptake protein [Planctomycetota bacterium]